ncbi:hypothetical protein Pmar_PMAR015615 [Perkinsus marinus ATCC 50983]|uniref:Uncharacterized protein n=1 Tax=Perkinsus marinus (strain ATCC 50983 / TXsc) TaxID=423536 RepID=C5L659_PERM5|nr:hypothetical protein Pmar_PMAR015615 [Perkinsus marinus ATCC 50983]EER07784.1 hypothetical protein Pmar_PMAR015615 [Perkinsus marinus ATCC 50983]|eukprot:XP_002775968.1 hypothetical protein Pmar_PMAR015615 [Perkinsus marinus ATCC 50983]
MKFFNTFVSVTSVLPLIVEANKNTLFEYLMCEQNPEEGGFVKRQFEDEILCWSKTTELGRQMHLISGFESMIQERPSIESYAVQRVKGSFMHTTRPSTFTLKNSFTYREHLWPTGPHTLTQDRERDLVKVVLVDENPPSELSLDLTRVQPLLPEDKSVRNVSLYGDTDKTIKVLLRDPREGDKKVFLLARERSHGSTHHVELEVDGYLLTSPVGNFKGTFYILRIEEREYVILLAQFSDRGEKRIKLF